MPHKKKPTPKKLTVKKPEVFHFCTRERVILSSLIKPIGTYEGVILFDSLKDNIKLTPKEIKDWNVRSIGNGMTWENKGLTFKKAIELNETEKEIISNGYKLAEKARLFHKDFVENFKKLGLAPKK